MEDYMIDIFVEMLNKTFPHSTYDSMRGSRYTRITRVPNKEESPVAYCFIENATGDAYYAASWRAPAPGEARGNISTAEGLEDVLHRSEESVALPQR